MDIGWLFAIPMTGIGFCAGWMAKPERPLPPWADGKIKGIGELPARVSDLERHVHHHAAPVAPASAPPPHGPDYVAWGHDMKTGKHWRRHKDGTVEHSDGKF